MNKEAFIMVVVALFVGIIFGYELYPCFHKNLVPPKPPQVITNNDYWNRIYWNQVKEEFNIKFENGK